MVTFKVASRINTQVKKRLIRSRRRFYDGEAPSYSNAIEKILKMMHSMTRVSNLFDSTNLKSHFRSR